VRRRLYASGNVSDFCPGFASRHDLLRIVCTVAGAGIIPTRMSLLALRLKPEAPAIGAGNPEGAPPVDITGAPRRSPVDVGAYQQGSDKQASFFGARRAAPLKRQDTADLAGRSQSALR
jgi:hypothetical protein